jgi:parvulin-like peptidyl-prolyl isomerase
MRNQPDTLRQKVAEVRTNNHEQLVRRQLILHDFKASYNVPEAMLNKDVDKEIEDRIRARFGDRMHLIKTLAAEGMTFEKYRQQVRDEFVLVALRQKNISSEMIISPHRVEQFYSARKNDFKVEDEVKLRMIVLNKSSDPAAPSAQKLAEEILTKLDDGVSFEEMARTYSQGSQRKEGGDWGWVERSVLRKELAEAAFGLKAGEHSRVIDTQEAVYLMKVEDKKLEHFKPLAEVREEIEKKMAVEERSRLEKQWVDKLRKKTFVRYF